MSDISPIHQHVHKHQHDSFCAGVASATTPGLHRFGHAGRLPSVAGELVKQLLA